MKQRTLFALHKWTGLVVGVQFLIWTITGLYFSLVGNEVLSSKQYQTSAPATPQRQFTASNWYPQFSEMTSTTLRNIAGINQWVVTYKNGSMQWFEADSGNHWRTDAETAQIVAEQSYVGSGEVANVVYFEQGFPALLSEEVASDAVYEVAFSDDISTMVYVSEANGEVLAHRNQWSLFHDWAFRLHFMDYNGGKNFNNPLTWTFAAAMLWFIFSGLWILKRIYLRR